MSGMVGPSAARTTAGAQKESRRRSRQETQRELQAAIFRVKERGEKLTISAVALVVGVTPGLVHNTYPDIAEAIRAQIGRATRQQRDVKIAELAVTTARLRELRGELDAANDDLKKLASINEALRAELEALRLVVGGKVVALPQRPQG